VCDQAVGLSSRKRQEVFTFSQRSYRLWSSQSSAVGMETTPRAGRCGFRTRLDATDIFHLQNIQTGSGVHPTSCSISNVFLWRGTAAGT